MVLRVTVYEVAPAGAVQVSKTWPLLAVAFNVGAAGGMQAPVGVTEVSRELADSQVEMVFTEDTT